MRRALLIAAAFAGCPAWAAQDTDSMQVTATVIASCEVAAQDLPFGNYDPVAAAPLDVNTTVEVTCTNGADYDVGLDEGAGAGATVAARRMTAGVDTLAYALYRDAARTQVWGETIDTDTVAGTGDGAAQTITVYGRVFAQQSAPAGAYADTVTVTVWFD